MLETADGVIVALLIALIWSIWTAALMVESNKDGEATFFTLIVATPIYGTLFTAASVVVGLIGVWLLGLL
jgi:hypothetical protein